VGYFLYEGIIEEAESFEVSGEEAKHILASRRIRKGQEIRIQDLDYRRYLARVESKERKSLVLMPLKELATPKEPELKIHLYQAMIKEKALDNIIQKTTELGVTSIYLFHSEFSQNSEKGAEKKLPRWQRIAEEACKQSGRIKPPEIHLLPETITFEELDFGGRPTFLFSLDGEPKSLREVSFEGEQLNLLIGPEGGWSQQETEALSCQRIHLGPRILRADTAAIAVVSIFQSMFGDFSQLPTQE